MDAAGPESGGGTEAPSDRVGGKEEEEEVNEVAKEVAKATPAVRQAPAFPLLGLVRHRRCQTIRASGESGRAACGHAHLPADFGALDEGPEVGWPICGPPGCPSPGPPGCPPGWRRAGAKVTAPCEVI